MVSDASLGPQLSGASSGLDFDDILRIVAAALTQGVLLALSVPRHGVTPAHTPSPVTAKESVMAGLELIAVVAVVVLLMGWLSRRTGLSEPLLLLGAGCLVGLTPPLASFTLSPEVVLFLFLPALLYWEALTSSVREIRDNFRSIALQSTGLVLGAARAAAGRGPMRGGRSGGARGARARAGAPAP
ncbi:cation:proton antiporter, partial [Streptomyces sp. NPDC059466]|uniref:cation:proton antiporter domain-containing protein n=1 Tax=Streptomyces sp. NPDC059466 TaxID=3346843 RepID=UPI003682AD05